MERDIYYAHSAPTRDGWELLRDHLLDVADRAASFAGVFGAAEEARLAGLLHDLGKYSDTFTRRLEGKESGLDHWSAGAWAAVSSFSERGTAAALAVQGHHVGLQSPAAVFELGDPARFAAHHPLQLKVTDADFAALVGRLSLDGLSLPNLEHSLYDHRGPPGAGMLDVRMLFSALVDADFLETDAHFQRTPDGRKSYRISGPALRAGEALALLQDHLARVARESLASPEVNSLRADLLQACLEAAAKPPGLYTLTAPTGAGKTLAMLAYALSHAAGHNLRRIVVAVPYLSIIEQTVREYRGLLAPAFGDFYVLEHHSLAGTRGEMNSFDQTEASRQAGLLAENWDAPLVVTTSVQLLESLLANRPSACRKLHRLAESVILLDEVQTLPPQLAAPTLATLSRLSERYRTTVVFATATQPAFDHLDPLVRRLAASGWKPAEIVPRDLDLFDRARRTRVVWETDRRTWTDLAGELAGLGTALCIVNLKRHALELADLLRRRGASGLFHLSTNMCPAHRERVLAEVRARLDPANPQPCLLISTQCVEAGVDVDFPVVYRAFGPLDAITQAAGRCNRNGKLAEWGVVRVFLPEDERYPPGGYEQAACVTRLLLKELGPEKMDLQRAELFDLYYRRLYDLTGATEGDQRKATRLAEAIRIRDFAAVAGLYRLIEQDAINVLVPYDREMFNRLRRELKNIGRLTARWIRPARAHTVNLFRPKDADPLWAYLEPAQQASQEEKKQDWFVLLDEQLYDSEMLGLTGAPQVWIA